MKEVKVKVAEVLKIVKANKKKHDVILKAALEIYWGKAKDVLNKCLSDIEQRKTINSYLDLPVPTDHSIDYDRVIRMMELSVDKNVILDDVSFSKFILNNWDWKQEFVRITTSYLGYSGYSGMSGYAGTSGYSEAEDALETF